MYEFYNPHPQNKIVADCVKRALTKATGLTYQEVSKELNAIKREKGASAYNVNSVWKEFLTRQKAQYLSFPAVKGQKRMNGERFCLQYPSGVYVLNMAGHLTCCVDGVIYDTWDCREKCVYTAYELVTETTDTILEEDKKVVHYYEKHREDGIMLMSIFSDVTGIKHKTTKKGERWIPLTAGAYQDVFAELLKRKHLHYRKKNGSLKSFWWDDVTGMEIILKEGDKPYVWCISVGESK